MVFAKPLEFTANVLIAQQLSNFAIWRPGVVVVDEHELQFVLRGDHAPTDRVAHANIVALDVTTHPIGADEVVVTLLGDMRWGIRVSKGEQLLAAIRDCRDAARAR
jgi:hypothetical protein